MEFRQGGEDLAVDDDVLLCFRSDEFRVGMTERAKSGVDLHAEESAEIGFLVLAVCELVDSRLAESDLCFDLLAASSVTKTLCKLEDLASVFICGYSSFDA